MKNSGYLSKSNNQAVVATCLTFVCGVATTIIVESPNKTAIFASGIVLAVVLFLLRMRVRVVYGLIEVAFGLYVLWNAAGKGHGSFSSGFSSGFDTFQLSVILIQTFGAIYILIRGLDNLFQALPAETRERIETRIKRWHL
jgi:hypothetical protein